MREKIIRLTESDLVRLVKRVISEQGDLEKKIKNNFNILLGKYYDETNNEVKIPVEKLNKDDYNQYMSLFWETYEETFLQDNPKVFYNNKEIKNNQKL